MGMRCFTVSSEWLREELFYGLRCYVCEKVEYCFCGSSGVHFGAMGRKLRVDGSGVE